NREPRLVSAAATSHLADGSSATLNARYDGTAPQMTVRQVLAPEVGRVSPSRFNSGSPETPAGRGALCAAILMLLVLGGGFPTSARAVSENRQTPTVRAVERARYGTVNIHSEKRARQSDSLFSTSKDNKI